MSVPVRSRASPRAALRLVFLGISWLLQLLIRLSVPTGSRPCNSNSYGVCGRPRLPAAANRVSVPDCIARTRMDTLGGGYCLWDASASCFNFHCPLAHPRMTMELARTSVCDELLLQHEAVQPDVDYASWWDGYWPDGSARPFQGTYPEYFQHMRDRPAAWGSNIELLAFCRASDIGALVCGEMPIMVIAHAQNHWWWYRGEGSSILDRKSVV